MIVMPDVQVDEGFLSTSTLASPFSFRRVSAIGFCMVSTDHFRQEIRSRFAGASGEGRKDLTIECGELYWSVSKLPIFDPWMIFCCNAMRAEMTTTDRLIFDDSKTSLLTIVYALPRHQRSLPK
jgi:hypothetical protein